MEEGDEGREEEGEQVARLSPAPGPFPARHPLPSLGPDTPSPQAPSIPRSPAVLAGPGGVGGWLRGAAGVEPRGPAASPPRPALLLGLQLGLHGVEGAARWLGAQEARWERHGARPLRPGDGFLSGRRRHLRRRHLPGFENGGRAATSQSGDAARLLGTWSPALLLPSGAKLHGICEGERGPQGRRLVVWGLVPKSPRPDY